MSLTLTLLPVGAVSDVAQRVEVILDGHRVTIKFGETRMPPLDVSELISHLHELRIAQRAMLGRGLDTTATRV